MLKFFWWNLGAPLCYCFCLSRDLKHWISCYLIHFSGSWNKTNTAFLQFPMFINWGFNWTVFFLFFSFDSLVRWALLLVGKHSFCGEDAWWQVPVPSFFAAACSLCKWNCSGVLFFSSYLFFSSRCMRMILEMTVMGWYQNFVMEDTLMIWLLQQ